MHPSPLSRTAVPSLLAALCALGTARSADSTFTEETLVADITSAQVTLSPRGVRVAAVIPKGSRQALVLDGVEGPRFDEIMSPGGLYEFTGMGGQARSIQYDRPQTTGHLVMGLGAGGTQRGIFSRDGKRHAYVGRSGSDVVLMLDGKEVHRGPYQQYSWLAFTPDGNRLIGVATLPHGQCVIVDGQAGPVGFDGSGVFVTADGAHYAYTGKNNDAQQTPWMVIDGRQVKHVGEIVGFDGSGRLLTRTVANYNQVLVMNGKPIAQGSSFNHLAINGNRLVLVVTPALGTPPQRKPSVITVDGQVLAGSEDVTVSRAYFSPDGKRYALLCQRTDPRMETFMIVDGKKELSYQNIYSTAPYEPSFSPDSTKFAYVAMAQGPGGLFVVVNGEESDAFGTLAGPYWSEVGSRLAYGGTTPAQKPVWFINGKSIPLVNNQPPGSTFRFTPDGAHHSWSFGPQHAQTLVVDGKPIPNVGGTGFIGTEGVDGTNTTVRISPNGKHVAYSGVDPKDNSRRGIWVDGKLVTPMTAPQGNRVTFSPDSQHVAWATYGVINNAAAYRVFVDGREVLNYASSQLDNTPGAWEMGADGTLTLLGIQDGALKRFRIPPPADSSITSMVGAGGSGGSVAVAPAPAPANTPAPGATPGATATPAPSFAPVARATPAAATGPTPEGLAAAGALTWQQLVARPDLWPKQCTLKVALQFQGGAKIAAGQKITVDRLTATEVEGTTLDGRTAFAAEPDETDALAVARAAYALLTPKQRALSYTALVQQKDLWPARITLTRGIDFNNGKSVRAGESLTVVEVQPQGVTVKSEALNASFVVETEATDVMAQARAFVEDPSAGPRLLALQQQEAQRQQTLGKLVVELEGKLVSSTTGQPAPLDTNTLPKYVVFLRGSSTCPITVQFLPSLIASDRDARAKKASYEIVYLMTEEPAATAQFARRAGFAWRAVTWEGTGTIPSLNGQIDGKLPQLLVMDRSGRVLVNGVQQTAPAALQQLDALLKQ